VQEGQSSFEETCDLEKSPSSTSTRSQRLQITRPGRVFSRVGVRGGFVSRLFSDGSLTADPDAFGTEESYNTRRVSCPGHGKVEVYLLCNILLILPDAPIPMAEERRRSGDQADDSNGQ